MADGEQQVLFEDTRRLHPKWGYDLDAVPRVLCLRCHKPIGDEEYVEDTGYARFGTMLSLHKRCWDECKEMDRQRRRSRRKGGPSSGTGKDS